MDYIALLKEDLEKGYSKSDLEKLIGLPKNNLSGILKGDRKLSKKSMLKIEKWEASEKPNPLELHDLVYGNGAREGQLVDKSLINLAKNATKGTPINSEYKNHTVKADIAYYSPDIEARIKELEADLKNPPKTAAIGVKNWIKTRQIELSQLKEKQRL